MSLRKFLSASIIASMAITFNFGFMADPDEARKKALSNSQLALAANERTEIAVVPSVNILQQKESKASLVEGYLLKGRLSVERDLNEELKQNPDDDNLRFGLGVLQFLQAIENLEQDFYRFGLRPLSTRELGLPLLRLPVLNNPHPQVLTYQKGREIVETFQKNLLEAESSLSTIKDPNVKLPIHFGLIKLDLNGDGKADDAETLWKIYSHVTRNNEIKPETAQEFVISFDRGDVHWLRGYCHLLSAVCDVYLAYDSKQTFDCCAHIFFPKVDSPYKFLPHAKHIHRIGGDDLDIMDLIAFIHTIHWEVAEPARMRAALHHFEAVVDQSHESWKWICAETDDDQEWLPNPNQTGVIPGMKVTKEMVDSWGGIMTRIDKVLAGELLIPFWRTTDGTGVNVRKIFMEPTTLDLVLWVQGPAAAPYLQKGQLFSGNAWRELESAFGDNFPGFAIWFN